MIKSEHAVAATDRYLPHSDRPTYTSDQYPGERNKGNFILIGNGTLDVPEDPHAAIERFNYLLAFRNQPLIEERIPVVAFGFNASPQGAGSKMKEFSNGAMSQEDLEMIPMMVGTLTDHAAVWHGRPAQGGHFFAELYKGKEVKGTQTEVWVQFLTPEQLGVIHASEGDTYKFSQVDGVVDLGAGVTVNGAVAYTARDAFIYLKDGKPVAVAGIEHTSSLEEMNVHGVLGDMLARSAIREAAQAETPQDYIRQAIDAPTLAARKAIQRRVQDALVDAGKSSPYAYESLIEYGRGDFDSLPRGLNGRPGHASTVRLVEQHVASIRPSKAFIESKRLQLALKNPKKSPEAIAAAAAKADPAVAIRRRVFEELALPHRSTEHEVHTRAEVGASTHLAPLDPRREHQLDKLWKAGVIKKNQQTYSDYQAKNRNTIIATDKV